MCVGCVAIAMASMMGPSQAPGVPAETLISAPKPDLKKEAVLRVQANFKEERQSNDYRSPQFKAI